MYARVYGLVQNKSIEYSPIVSISMIYIGHPPLNKELASFQKQRSIGIFSRARIGPDPFFWANATPLVDNLHCISLPRSAAGGRETGRSKKVRTPNPRLDCVVFLIFGQCMCGITCGGVYFRCFLSTGVSRSRRTLNTCPVAPEPSLILSAPTSYTSLTTPECCV